MQSKATPFDPVETGNIEKHKPRGQAKMLREQAELLMRKHVMPCYCQQHHDKCHYKLECVDLAVKTIMLTQGVFDIISTKIVIFSTKAFTSYQDIVESLASFGWARIFIARSFRPIDS